MTNFEQIATVAAFSAVIVMAWWDYFAARARRRSGDRENGA